MSRKDYIALADAIHRVIDQSGTDEQMAVIRDITERIGEVLMDDNPNFDFGKFAKAVYGN